MKKRTALLCMAALIAVIAVGCSEQTDPSAQDGSSPPAVSQEQQTTLEDGIYSADFETDSSMFRVNETCDGKGKLTVQDGKMTIHISLTSQSIVNLFPGTAEDAQKDGAELLLPTVDTVTYEDGISEEVNGFDVPVPALDEPFNLALIGTKGKWYDHEVIVSNPEKLE